MAGLNKPVNLAFTTNPDSKAIAYVTELYGTIKAFDRDWKAHIFADDLLNFEPHPEIPGEGESGAINDISSTKKAHQIQALTIGLDGGGVSESGSTLR